MDNLIERGLQEKLICFDEKQETITYIYQNKKRAYTNPEEKIQANTFLKLVLELKYPVEHIQQFVSIQMGSSVKEADIVVYNDTAHKSPYIVVECKKDDISDLMFKSAVDQAFSYAVAEGASYVWVSSGLKDEFYKVPKEKPKDRISIPDIPKYGSTTIKEYKFAFNDQQFSSLEKVSESELVQIFKQAHNALWGGGELNPSEAFDELDKLIFCKIWDEKQMEEKPKQNKGKPYHFQIIAREENGVQISNKIINQELKDRILKLYENGREKDPEIFKDDIKLSAEKIRSVVGYLQKVNLSKTDLDSKGRAFESFLGSFFRGNFGQYFTPRAIVKFIVDVLPIDEKSKVLDSSCGSGGFLLYALDKVRKEADKEFGEFDEETGSYIVPENHQKHHNYWHNFAQNCLYGIEINKQISRVAKMNMIIHDDGHTNVIECDGLNPITPKPQEWLNQKYNEIDKQKNKEKEDTKKLLQNKKEELQIKLKEIEEERNKEKDSAKEEFEQYNASTIQVKSGNFKFEENSFDFIITNPPFGSIIKQAEKAYLHQYSLAHKEINWLDISDKQERQKRENQSTEVLFIEQGYKFLKEDGFLAIVIPDGILTNSSLQYVRDSVEEMFRIIAVVSMPQTAFSANGAGVKSSVLFLRKYRGEQSEKIKNLKINLQRDSLEDPAHDYKRKANELLANKKQELKELNKLFPSKKDKQTDEYKSKKADIDQRHKKELELLQSRLLESYSDKKTRLFKEQGLDYEIFMAIAENIGYDATGKETGINELDYIGKKLREFINNITKVES
ncbi:N-6 DNA methylase [Campylobacter sp. MIT 12-5580]|uniref:restriction endonuclease subunit M n=1 Tax=Campylobacter sp. MIT 12-5580 TaxID=2040651 RepID=UPI001BB17C2B|nr:N-6 DNA methylase [Campylobacter sp. MIT 12-5580]